MSILKSKKNQRPNLYSPQTYDSEAHKTEQPFVYEHPDTAWTTSDYSIPKSFIQFYCIDFAKQASSMMNSVDEGVPYYMDQSIYDAYGEALGILIHKHSLHSESISEIISRKRVTKNCIERELSDIEAEEEKISRLVEEIGGYDYE